MNRFKLLIVDDEERIRKVLHDYFIKNTLSKIVFFANYFNFGTTCSNLCKIIA